MESLYHPQFGAVVNVDSAPLSDEPDRAIAETIHLMTRYAVEDSRSDIVRSALLAALPLDGLDTATPFTLCGHIHTWVRSHVHFLDDDVPAAGAGFGSGHEVLIRPVDLLRMPSPAEDCDGFAMLVASMLLAARDMLHFAYLPSFVTVAANAASPDEFSHVYNYVAINGRVVCLDASHGPVVGWEVPNRFHKRAVWPIGEFMLAVSRRLSGLRDVPTDTYLEPGGSSIDLGPGYFGSGGFGGGTSGDTGGAGINWNAILPGLFSAGERIATQVTLPSGTFIQTTPQGSIISRNVPGAVPSGASLGLNVGGASSTWLILAGAAVLAVLMLSKR